MLIRHRVYLISAGLVAVLVAIGATVPNRFRDVAEATLNTLGHYFGWFYLISTFVFVIFLLALAMTTTNAAGAGADKYSCWRWR